MGAKWPILCALGGPGAVVDDARQLLAVRDTKTSWIKGIFRSYRNLGSQLLSALELA